MKKIISTLFLGICLTSALGGVSADNGPEYLNSGYTIDNSTIWILDSPPYQRNNNVCLENEGVTKYCLFACYFCSENEAIKEERSLLPVDKKGIFYFEDEFNLNFYNIRTKEIADISNAIARLIGAHEIDSDLHNLIWDDRYFNSFTDKSLSPDKKRLAVEVVYNDPPTMDVRASMICNVDIEKLSQNEEGYVECPIVTKEMRNLDLTNIPGNTWNNTEDMPVLEGWKEDGSLDIEAVKIPPYLPVKPAYDDPQALAVAGGDKETENATEMEKGASGLSLWGGGSVITILIFAGFIYLKKRSK